jgi:molecular chaperone Hsp33
MTIFADSLHRFTFDGLRVRGELASLDASWRAVLERHPYPAVVRRPLGEALTSVLLLAATLKFEGNLILQAQGDGPLRTLVAQATHDRTVRGLARWNGVIADGTLAQQMGDGRLILTLQPRAGERYQGIIPLSGDGFGDAVEDYFGASEQLPTRLWLAVSDTRAVGLMLQRLPGDSTDEDAWGRTCVLADTVTDDELLGLGVGDLLQRLFHEEDVRLFEPEPIAFRCGCSRMRIADTLRALGQSEVESIVADQGGVDVTCEFCNRRYSFDPVDARGLFSAAVPSIGPETLQ